MAQKIENLINCNDDQRVGVSQEMVIEDKKMEDREVILAS